LKKGIIRKMSLVEVKSLNQLSAKAILVILVLYAFYLVYQIFQSNEVTTGPHFDKDNQALKSNYQMPAVNVPYGLFGSVKKHNNYKAVKKTKLNLNLIGTLSSGTKSLAIIKGRRGEAKIYAIGDLVAPSAYLEDVQEKMIIIRRGKELEKISIDFKEANLSSKMPTLNLKSKKPTASKKSTKSKLSAKQKKRIQLYLSQLNNDKDALKSLVVIRTQSGQTSVVIYPGKESELFFKFGFKPGDMILGIDHISLDGSKQWNVISSLLLKQKRFNVIINRQGEIKNLLINIE